MFFFADKFVNSVLMGFIKGFDDEMYWIHFIFKISMGEKRPVHMLAALTVMSVIITQLPIKQPCTTPF